MRFLSPLLRRVVYALIPDAVQSNRAAYEQRVRRFARPSQPAISGALRIRFLHLARLLAFHWFLVSLHRRCSF